MANFFAELKRRHIYRVGAAYVVAAWAVAQVIDLLSQVFALPSWIAQPTIIVLAVGFPIALVITWVVESKPQEVIVSAVRSKPTTVDWMLFAAMAMLITLNGYRLIAPSSDVPTRQAGVNAAREAGASPATAVSIAVLPFANLSGDAQQEFFSDGITEEITSALARVPDLRVVARTSAYQFRDQNRDIQSIGQQLHATHFIEGSVRKAGDRVRITAQLIKADDGTHVWTENYDRELTDVFAIQEDIATAIALALRVPLGLRPGETLVSLRPKDEETYELFLRGRAAYRARSIPEAVGLLEQVVARDPNFAPGWASYARALIPSAAAGDESKQRILDSAARKAITLAPRYAGGYGVLAGQAARGAKYLEAMDLFKQALARDPDDPEILNGYGVSLRTLGYLKESLNAAERVHLLEPLVPIYSLLRAEILAANGMAETGVREWLRTRSDPTAGEQFLAPAYAQLGRFNDAVDVLLQGDTQLWTRDQAQAAVQVLRKAVSKSEPSPLPDFHSDLNFVYAYTRAPERMLDWPEMAVKQKQGPWLQILRTVWWPAPSSVRKTDRFKTLVRAAGLVDYWKARGWPDLCRPMGADDFVCE